MSFNKNSSKRLSILAGVERGSRELTDIINKIVKQYLHDIIYNLIQIVLFTGRKTITTDDFKILSKISPIYPNIIVANDLSKLTRLCIDTQDILTVMNCNSGYNVYTLKNPFNNYIREITRDLCEEEIRLGKNVVILLQNMVEHHLITIMNQAITYTNGDNRDTLLSKDIEIVLDLNR